MTQRREPKFKIGQSLFFKDEVDHYVALHNGKYDTYSNQRPRSNTVVEIISSECDAGIQISYRFAMITILISELVLIEELPILTEKKR